MKNTHIFHNKEKLSKRSQCFTFSKSLQEQLHSLHLSQQVTLNRFD